MENNINEQGREAKHVKILDNLECLYEAIGLLEQLTAEIKGKKEEDRNKTSSRPVAGKVIHPVLSLAETLKRLPGSLHACGVRVANCVKELRELLF